eukprot:TRINITY_DN3161_c0_g1_i1.p1 TRINITY_DN3161_c0_g1~~TRINITY_DN3161_c0_g1_i1.p1  ORF type:complete len:870 (-),score=446.13 TRINITY_DN3161_c0_g1_i1:272-2881(-)
MPRVQFREWTELVNPYVKSAKKRVSYILGFEEKEDENEGEGGRVQISLPDYEIQVSNPMEVVRKLHVDSDFNWTGEGVIDSFDLLDIVGEGSFGSVWKARYKPSNKIFAIKIMKTNGNHDDSSSGSSSISEENNEEIQKEINILKRMKHENIVAYWGAIPSPEGLWIVMDYCQIGSLDDLMNKLNETFTEEEIRYSTFYVLKGLSYLHSQKVIHRDIKAANILLDGDAIIKIADFGVSAETTFDDKRKTLVGTPYWMAPEALSMAHKKREYDYKVDIWSVGITVMEMAEGSPPHYNEKTPAAAMRAIPQLPAPSLKGNSFSSELKSFVSDCLKKNAAERGDSLQLLNHPFLGGEDEGKRKIPPPKSLKQKIINYVFAVQMEKTKEKEKKDSNNSTSNSTKRGRGRDTESSTRSSSRSTGSSTSESTGTTVFNGDSISGTTVFHENDSGTTVFKGDSDGTTVFKGESEENDSGTTIFKENGGKDSSDGILFKNNTGKSGSYEDSGTFIVKRGTLPPISEGNSIEKEGKKGRPGKKGRNVEAKEGKGALRHQKKEIEKSEVQTVENSKKKEDQSVKNWTFGGKEKIGMGIFIFGVILAAGFYWKWGNNEGKDVISIRNTPLDLYKTLGVERLESTKQIMKMGHESILKNHPDKYKGKKGREEANRIFEEIMFAYETLKDEEKREIYDSSHPEAGINVIDEEEKRFDTWWGFKSKEEKKPVESVPQSHKSIEKEEESPTKSILDPLWNTFAKEEEQKKVEEENKRKEEKKREEERILKEKLEKEKKKEEKDAKGVIESIGEMAKKIITLKTEEKEDKKEEKREEKQLNPSKDNALMSTTDSKFYIDLSVKLKEMASSFVRFLSDWWHFTLRE